MPVQTSGSLTATGSVTVTKPATDTTVLFEISGTYGSVSFVFEGSLDGTNFFPLFAQRLDTGPVVTGTISPADNSTLAWLVNGTGMGQVRARVTAIGSGTVTFAAYSLAVVGNPFNFTSQTGQTISGNVIATSVSANALTAGAAGSTNPAFNVDASVASQATGLGVTGRAAGAGVTLGTLSSGANEDLLVAPKGTGGVKLTSTSADAFDVGPAGATNPTLQVDASTASAATGLKVKSAAAGGGLALSVVSSGANEALKIDTKGTGTITVGGTSTGLISVGRGSVSTAIFSGTKTSVAAQNATPTAAQLLGGYVAHATVTGAGTVTLDTAANIDAAIPNVATGDCFTCYYANTGSQTGTITTAAGLTLRGTAAVPSGKNAILEFFRTGSATYDVIITLSA